MTGLGYVLGQLIGLALIPAVLVWVLRGTRPGRVVWRAVADAVALPAKRRQAAEAQARHDRYAMWLASTLWWIHERDRHRPGATEYEAAHDLVTYFQLHRPDPCYCSACSGFNPHSPRSYQP